MILRRTFLASSSALVATMSMPFAPDTTRAETPALSEEQTKLVEWMDAATGVGKEVAGGVLSVTRFADAFWYLTRGINWSPGQGQKLPSVSVPAGFVTDFASIPRPLWTALPRDGDYVWAAVVHDYLYWYQTTTKDTADDVLNAAMIDFKIPDLERLAIYQGVHLGGTSSWNENTRLRKNGEKRILKLFPDQPTISWQDWKKRPDVFAG
jgi:hypothetical protein